MAKANNHMRRKWLLSLSWSQHTHSHGRDCWLQNITFICTCVCVIVQVRSYPFSSTRNQKSKNHLDNNTIASSAMKGFALPNKDMVICFLALFYSVFHLWKNKFKLLPAGKTFLETAGFLLRNPEIFLVYSVRLRFILQSALACEKLATFRITLQNLHYVWLSKHQVIKIIIFHLNGQHWFTWIRHMAIIKHKYINCCLMQGFWQCAVVQDCTIWSNPHNTVQFLHNSGKWALEFLEINILLFITT